MDEITNVSIDPVQPPQSPVPPPEPQEHPEAVPTARRTYSRSMLNLALYAVISEVLITVITIIRAPECGLLSDSLRHHVSDRVPDLSAALKAH